MKLHNLGCVKLILTCQASKMNLADIKRIHIQYFQHQMDISTLSTQVILLSGLVRRLVLLIYCSVIYEGKLCFQVWITKVQIIIIIKCHQCHQMCLVFSIDSSITKYLFMCLPVVAHLPFLSVDKPFEF